MALLFRSTITPLHHPASTNASTALNTEPPVVLVSSTASTRRLATGGPRCVAASRVSLCAPGVEALTCGRAAHHGCGTVGAEQNHRGIGFSRQPALVSLTDDWRHRPVERDRRMSTQ
jgi:hypothetical protein